MNHPEPSPFSASASADPAGPDPEAPVSRAHAFLFRLGGAALIVAATAGLLQIRAHRHLAEAHEGATRAEALEAGPLIQAAKVTATPPVRTLTVSGDAQAFVKTTLYAKLSGYLRVINVDKGDHVKAGQVLGVIESPETRQDIVSGQADLAMKKLIEGRYQALVREGLVSTQDLEQATTNKRVSAATLERLNVVEGYEVIRAPFDGVITARHADPGALLQAATSSTSALPLVDVARIDRLRVYVYLGQNEALFVHEGDAVTVWTDQRPGERTEAQITRLSKTLDPRSRTMLTEIDVDNKAGTIYPGTFVRVSLKVPSAGALAVPADAVFLRDAHSMVAVVREGRAKFVPVETGDTDGKTVRVTAGLVEGDVVGLHVGDEVEDGGRVRTVMR